MVFIIVAVIIIGVFVFISKAQLKAPVPKTRWRLFNSRKSVFLDEETIKKLEGIYVVAEGNEFFGDRAVIKWSVITEGDKKKHHLSIFMEKDAAYFVCEAKRFRNKILLNGYWSKVETSETGRARFRISARNGAFKVFNKEVLDERNTITIAGRFDKRKKLIWTRLNLQYKKPLANKFPFHVLAHRGAGTNSNFYAFSENSLESIKMTPLLGASGLEIDVRLTADNVPVVFHDFVLSTRAIENYLLAELLNSKTYEDLKKLRLKKGGRIPTLKEALDLILYSTQLEIVWLDIKYDGDLHVILELQQEYHQKAITLKRNLKIYIGIPDRAALKQFSELPDCKNIPSLIELDIEDVQNYNAEIWAPKWSSIHKDDLEKMRKEGREIFTWTVDPAENIKHFMFIEKFDAILSNVPSLVAFYYYSA